MDLYLLSLFLVVAIKVLLTSKTLKQAALMVFKNNLIKQDFVCLCAYLHLLFITVKKTKNV